MRTGKELIEASKAFTGENRLRSWIELFITVILSAAFLTGTFLSIIPIPVRLICSIAVGLLYVRLFVIYHDYQHRAILQNSAIASVLMQGIGIFLLAPENIWKRSHDHHHNNNSKLTTAGIGSYPTVCKERYMRLTPKQRHMYLINRHPLTVIFGYFTLFIYWLNIKSFTESPKKHIDSIVALLLHFAGTLTVWYFLGAGTFFISCFIPFFLAFGMGSYLFYCQHNFPGAQFRENHDWKYDHAALASTSYMVMNPVMQWFTGNIGYHHVHHLNSRIPFYRLIEAMENMPELKNVTKSSWSPFEMARCFKLKLWDPENSKMITLKQLESQNKIASRKFAERPL